MSLAVLARKSGTLHNRNRSQKGFAICKTGDRPKMAGCCRRGIVPPPGLRWQFSNIGPPPPTPTATVSAVPRTPIQQMGYGVYLGRKSGRVAGRLVYDGPSGKDQGHIFWQNSSDQIEKKKIKQLRQPECCPTGADRVVTLGTLGQITGGPTEFTRGCSYLFTFGAGEITSIGGVNIYSSDTSYVWSACGCPDGGRLVIVAVSGPTTQSYTIVAPPSGRNPGTVKNRCCRDKGPSSGCTARYENGNIGNISVKQRPRYVRLTNNCCPTTKSLNVMSSDDYIKKLKGRRQCYCADPEHKQNCYRCRCAASAL